MNKFPYLSKDRLGSQHPSPSGSLPPRAISFVCHVLPPSKLTPSNIPADSPASPWPTLVTVTMLSGLAGLTAIASSDSFRCRWLMSILAGVAAKARDPARAAASAAGVAASTAPASIAATVIGNRKRYIIKPSSPRPFPKATPGPCRLGRARCARTDASQEAADDEPAAFPILRSCAGTGLPQREGRA